MNRRDPFAPGRRIPAANDGTAVWLAVIVLLLAVLGLGVALAEPADDAHLPAPYETGEPIPTDIEP